jgi:hypothetical protein
MSARSAAWLAWSVCAFSVALTLIYVVLNLLTPPIPMRELGLGYDVFFTIGLLLYPTVGALVASRRPHNPIGWIFCGIGFLSAAQSFAVAYGDYSLVVRHGVGVHAQHVPAAIDFGALAGVKIMAWLSSWIGSDAIGLIGVALLFLLFPNGRLLSSSWRPVMWTAVGAGAALFVVDAFIPGPLYTFPFITNPVGIGGTVGHILGMLGNIGLVVLLIALLASAVSLILRLRRAKGVERQQLKWFVYAATLATIGTVVSYAGAYVFASDLINAIGYWEGQLAFAALPVFTGIAILRYRLYDIDIIINRTLVYGLLTILLGAGYLATIMALQGIGNLVFQVPFRALTGQNSALATVAATLAMAALFNPLRRRIQSFIDRSFYRNKYDAAKTLEAFSTKLRDETDLKALSDDLVGVVRETMQPAHVSLWLHPDPALKDKKKRAAIREAGRDEQ